MAVSRLLRLPDRRLAGGLRVSEARGVRARALGLAFLRPPPAGQALLIPRCRCVHTFGMRFALDLVFLGADDAVERVVRGVPPRRIVGCRRARSVVEMPAGEGARFLVAGLARGGPAGGGGRAGHYPGASP